MVTAALLSVLAQFSTDVFDRADAFTVLETHAGVTLSEREVKGSPYREYRARLATPHTVEQLCVAVYEWGTRHGDGPGVTMNKLLADTEDLRVLYNQISQPVVARRDYALVIARERLPDGNCRIRFRVDNSTAPPKPEGFVRMDKLWGEWRLEAAPEGGATITYTLFSDPAGSIPPFLVHGAQKRVTREAALQAAAKTKRYVETGKP